MNNAFVPKPKETYRELIVREIHRIYIEMGEQLKKNTPIGIGKSAKLLHLLCRLEECLRWSPNGGLTPEHIDIPLCNDFVLAEDAILENDLRELIVWSRERHLRVHGNMHYSSYHTQD